MWGLTIGRTLNTSLPLEMTLDSVGSLDNLPELESRQHIGFTIECDYVAEESHVRWGLG